MYPFGILGLGIIILVIGLLVASLHALFIVGIILIVAGLVLYFLPIGGGGRHLGARRR